MRAVQVKNCCLYFIFQYCLGAAFRGHYADYTKYRMIWSVGRDIMVRQVLRKALERCVTDGRVKGTASAVGKIVIEEVAGAGLGFRAQGPRGPAPDITAGTVLPAGLVLLAGSTQGVPSLLTVGV